MPIVGCSEYSLIDVHGSKCTAAVAREFWLNGERVTETCAFFLQLDGKQWLQISLNDESYSWETCPTDPPEDIVPFDGCEYPHVDIGTQMGLVGQRIAGIEAHDFDGGTLARIVFDDHPSMEIRYCYETETEQILRGDSQQ